MASTSTSTKEEAVIPIRYSGETYNCVPQAGDRVIRIRELKNLIGLSKTTIYEMMKGGEFDKGFLIGKRARGWLLSSALNWLESRKVGA